MKPRFDVSFNFGKAPARDAKQQLPPARHVAAAMHRGSVIEYAQNVPGTHAECSLIRKHKLKCYSKKNLSIYVTRISGHSYSRPCDNCIRSMFAWNPNITVYYTNKDGLWIKL